MSHDPDSSLPEAEKLTDVSDRASDIEQRATAQVGMAHDGGDHRTTSASSTRRTSRTR